MARDPLRMWVRCDEFAPTYVRQEMTRLPDLGCVLEDAMLVASELVTNAVRHFRCTDDEFLSVCITRDGRLRISVLDPGGSGREAEIADRPIELGGLGLKLVELIASAWGTERRDDGYQVWAELDLQT